MKKFLPCLTVAVLSALAGCVEPGQGGERGGFGAAAAPAPARGTMFGSADQQQRPLSGFAFASQAPSAAAAPAAPAGPQALFGAAARGDVSAIESLLGQGANVNVRNPNGATPLQLAAAGGYVPAVQTLLANGADVNAADNSGTTPLAAATAGGYDAVIRTLKAAGAAAPNAAAQPQSQDATPWWKK